MSRDPNAVARVSTAGFLLVALAACGGAERNAPGSISQASTTSNGVTRNGVTRNGVTRNGVTRNGVTRNGIVSSSGANRAFTGSGLNGQSLSSQDPASTAEFLEYTVSCALPAGASAQVAVNGSWETFPGEIGLAPQWRTRSCDVSCQQWVSACLLARTNYYGVHVQLSARGPHPALASGFFERLQYPLEEGAFFGNLFSDQPRMYACTGQMFDNPLLGDLIGWLERRVCADDTVECPLQVVGPCSKFLTPPWTLSPARACGGQDPGARDYLQCHAQLGMPGFPQGSVAYPHVVTTFLNPLTLPWWILGGGSTGGSTDNGGSTGDSTSNGGSTGP